MITQTTNCPRKRGSSNHIIMRCLEKDPERRWQTARDIAAELEFLAHESPRLHRRLRVSSRFVSIAAAIVFAGLAAWAWVSSYDASTDSAPTPGEPEAQASANNLLAKLTSFERSARLAVLPFDNISDDPLLDQLAQGIPDGVANLVDTPVIASSTSFPYKGKPVCSAAEEMGVRFVLDGTVSAFGDRLRTSAHLLDCPSETRTWDGSFEHQRGDLFAAQDAFAEQIQAEIGILIWTHMMRSGGSPFVFISKGTREDNEIALEIARRGAELEPRAVRWVENMHDAYLQRRYWGWGDAHEALAEMEDLRELCVALDPGGCSFYDAIIHNAKGDSEQEIAAWRRALVEIGQPGHHAWLGSALALAGRLEEATEEVEIARREANLDAWENIIDHATALTHFAAREYEAALLPGRRCIEPSRYPSDGFNLRARCHELLAATYGQLGLLDEAEAEANEMMRLRPNILLEDIIDIHFRASTEELRERVVEGLRSAGVPSRQR